MAARCPIATISGWPEVTLGDITRKIGSGSTPRGGSDTYMSSRVTFALIRSQNVFDRRFDRNGLAFITDEQADGLRGVKLERGDVLLNITGDGVTFGRSCIVPDDVRPACVNQHVSIIRVEPTKADAGYVLAFLTHPEVKTYIESFNAGGSRRAITKGHIESFRLPLPPLPIQRAIAHILGSLDDKMELNRRMNETLEGIARALFKSWFIDFDPVRAKADGRKPEGMDEATAAHFTNSFNNSEAGYIPKGWSLGTVSDLSKFSRAAISPTKFPTEIFDHFSLPSFDEGRIPKVELGSAIMSNKLIVTPDSVLLSKLNPHIPRIWLPDIHPTRRSICSTEFMVATSKSESSREYLYLLFTSTPFAAVYGTLTTGTTGSHQRIKPESVLDMQVVIPPRTLTRVFTDRVKPMLDRINRNTEQSRSLAETRDSLLPKLLSGELRIKDAERFVEAAL